MYEKSYQPPVNQNKKQERKPIAWRAIIRNLIILILVSGIIVLIKLPALQIKEIRVVGAQVEDPIEISQYITNHLKNNYLYIFPKSSAFLVNTDKLTKHLKAHYPRFERVSVKREAINKLKVEVNEYNGKYLWCNIDNVCSFMSAEGIVFADAPYFSGNAYLKFYGPQQSTYPYQPISLSEIKLMGEVVDGVRKVDIDPISLEITDNNQVNLTFVHNRNLALIKFDLNQDLQKTLNALYIGLQTEPLATWYQDKNKVLEYLDLRSVNKVAYKFQ